MWFHNRVVPLGPDTPGIILLYVVLYTWHGRPGDLFHGGNPRMLRVLVREFKSRRGEILSLFAKIKKDPTRVCGQKTV